MKLNRKSFQMYLSQCSEIVQKKRLHQHINLIKLYKERVVKISIFQLIYNQFILNIICHYLMNMSQANILVNYKIPKVLRNYYYLPRWNTKIR